MFRLFLPARLFFLATICGKSFCVQPLEMSRISPHE
jgi:hypothetical protein